MEHDLIGKEGLLNIHQKKVERIQIDTRIDNEKYLREHPEIEFIIQNFLVKLLEDKPDKVINFAGKYFHDTNFRALYEESLKEESMQEKPGEEDEK